MEAVQELARVTSTVRIVACYDPRYYPSSDLAPPVASQRFDPNGLLPPDFWTHLFSCGILILNGSDNEKLLEVCDELVKGIMEREGNINSMPLILTVIDAQGQLLKTTSDEVATALQVSINQENHSE